MELDKIRSSEIGSIIPTLMQKKTFAETSKETYSTIF